MRNVPLRKSFLLNTELKTLESLRYKVNQLPLHGVVARLPVIHLHRDVIGSLAVLCHGREKWKIASSFVSAEEGTSNCYRVCMV